MILTKGGGFSVQKGMGTVLGHETGESLSKRCPTSWSISASVKVEQKKECIRSE
jgi:hypothetical protein